MPAEKHDRRWRYDVVPEWMERLRGWRYRRSSRPMGVYARYRGLGQFRTDYSLFLRTGGVGPYDEPSPPCPSCGARAICEDDVCANCGRRLNPFAKRVTKGEHVDLSGEARAVTPMVAKPTRTWKIVAHLVDASSGRAVCGRCTDRQEWVVATNDIEVCRTCRRRQEEGRW